MCGIVGYIGNKQAQSILCNSLKRLEYRGYDSCGIAVSSDGISVYKDAIRIDRLRKEAPKLSGSMGIGHTRWATHGAPSQVNSHPHLDCTGRIAVVHNGVITNYRTLREQLISEGHELVSETDTEVIPHLIEKYYRDNLEEAVTAALHELEGSYAIIVLLANGSRLIAARKDSPLIIGIGDRENYIASDVPAILDYTDRVIYMEDGDIGVITKDEIRIMRNDSAVEWQEDKILWSVTEAQKSGYKHFFLKEIHEQPRVIRDTLSEYTREVNQIADLSLISTTRLDSLLMVASGTSYHAALIGKYVMEDMLQVPVRVEMAHEFNYISRPLTHTLAIAIAQSGETADTLKAMKKLRDLGCRIIVITNVVGSSASRIAHQTIYTKAGPEISVAATKSFISQLMTLYWLAMSYSRIDTRKLTDMIMELRQLPSKVQQVLDNEAMVVENARYLSQFDNAFFIGRGINLPIALEGALKLKEISYIHAEGYAAGETKHGPFALLGADTPVIALVARDNTYDAMLTNIKEIKARNSPVIALVEEGDENIEELCDFMITVPHVTSIFSPVVNIVALQLLAYYTAKERDCPIDFPRNLAKSVTVE